MKRFFPLFLCFALSLIWIPTPTQAEVFDEKILIKEGSTLIFGNEPLPFPAGSQLRRVFSESNTDQSYLREISPEDNEVKQIINLMNNLFRSSDMIFYQALIPADVGYKQAFLITVQLPKDNFMKSQWVPCFQIPSPILF